MGIDSLASGLIAAQLARLQMAAVAKMMQMDMQPAADIAQLIQAAQQNLDRLANIAAGIGTNLDVSV